MTSAEPSPLRRRLALEPRLGRRRTLPKDVSGWLMPGADPAGWLEALHSFDGPAARKGSLGFVLFVVPESTTGRGAAGLVVLAPEGAGVPGTEFGGGALRREGNALLPVDARFDPPLGVDETAAVFPMHLHLLHPRLGHVGFEAADALRASDLLAAPPLLSGTWAAAREGATLPNSIGPVAALITADDLVRFEQQGRESIGVESPEGLVPRGPLQTLRKLPSRAFLRLPATLLARTALWYAARVPPTADSDTWVDRAAGWAQRVLSSSEGGQRAREVRRLIELLRDDPDEGLRFALPIGDDPLARGRHWGADRLGERNPDFDSSRLGGTRGADAWDIDVDARRELESLYRARALEDAAAGRHRRAAYIHAHLLGDLRSAARVLEEGGHVREAAALWQGRIGDDAEAARCFEAGGLFEEALSIHRGRKDHAAEARLLDRLRRTDEARAAWRRAMEAAIERGDPLGAARILESKLHHPDEAAALLRSRWPAGKRGVACLDAWFELCDRRGRSDELLEWIDEERDRALVGGRALPLLAMLGARCGELRHAATREALSDALRCAVGRALTDDRRLPFDEVRARLETLRGTAGPDALLDRDLTRFRDAAARRQPKPSRRPATAKRAELVASGAFQLPPPENGETRWPLHGDAAGLVIATHRIREQALIVERRGWDGERLDEVVVSGVDAGHARATFLPRSLAADPDGLVLFRDRQVRGRAVAIGRSGGGRGAALLELWTPSFLSESTVDVRSTRGGEVWAAQLGEAGDLWLRRFDADGRIMEDERLGRHDPGVPVRIGWIGRSPVVFRGDGILRLSDDGPRHPLRLRSETFDVHVSPHGSLGRSLLVTDGGVRLFTEVSGMIRDLWLSREPGARANFTRDGAIAIADAASVRVLRTRGPEAHLVARQETAPAERGEVLSIVPGRAVDEFAVVREAGTTSLFRIRE